jgi:hypothetical protein
MCLRWKALGKPFVGDLSAILNCRREADNPVCQRTRAVWRMFLACKQEAGPDISVLAGREPDCPMV